MLELMIKILPTVVALGLLIFVHELGHFLACRLTGVGVQKFSIGFGPEILSWQGPRTRYSISLIPFGGFVKPQGETVDEVKKRGKIKGDYVTANVFSRFLILIAGVAMNFLFAYVLFAAVLYIGRPVLPTTLGEFVEGYPAANSGLEVGDKVVSLNGNPVTNWQELTFQILESTQNPLEFMVERNGQEILIPVQANFEDGKDVFGSKKSVARIGIKPVKETITEKYELKEALKRAWEFEVKLTVMTYEALWRLVTGRLEFKTVSGPIGIVSMAGDAAEMGLSTFLQFMGLLSVSLAVINILPIPALDGGHLFFLFLEIIFRRPVSFSFQERVTQIGFVGLMILMLVVIYNDLNNVGAVEKVTKSANSYIKSFFQSLDRTLTGRVSKSIGDAPEKFTSH